MDQPRYRRHGSFVGPIILIVLGLLFLAFNLYPNFNPFPILFRYWPLILILIGLGKIWDSYYFRRHSDPNAAQATPWITGTGIAWILLLVFFILAAWHSHDRWQDRSWGRPWMWHGHTLTDATTSTQAVELQGAKTVNRDLNMPAGELTLAGGSSRLMDAEFRYDRHDNRPNVEYSVSGDRGELHITEDESQPHPHWGGEDVDWNLRIANDVPTDLQIQIGAGHSDLRLNGVNVKSMDVHMGAGQLDLDLTGQRKTNLEGTIEGGVGQATVRLPKDVGVRVDASGGIGSVNFRGLKRDGGYYVNDAYGKSPTNINLTIHGGIGQIDLIEE